MSLHDEVMVEQGSGRQTQCKVCIYVAGLPPAEAEEWRSELALPPAVVTTTALWRILKRRGATIGDTSLREHRRTHR